MITLAIIGAGPLGRWFALTAARCGLPVFVEDVMPSNLHHAQEYLRRQLGPVLADEAHAGGAATAVHHGVTFVASIEDAVRSADLVIDCVPDELESKLEILWLLDRMAPPRTVIMTPTTQLSISDLAGCTYRPDKCIAIAAEARGLAEQPASEIVLRTTARTSPETLQLARTFWQALGYDPRFEQAD